MNCTRWTRFALLAATLLAGPTAAQPAGPIPTVGFIAYSSVTREELERQALPPQRAFIEALRERGWVDGRNVRFAWRTGGGAERLRLEAVDELARLPVDVLVAPGPIAKTAAERTRAIPIVGVAFDSDLVSSLARPGGNLTGILGGLDVDDGLRFKGMLASLLKEISGATRVAWVQPVGPNESLDGSIGPRNRGEADRAGVKLSLLNLQSPEQLEKAFSDMVRRGVDGLIVLNSPYWTPALSERFVKLVRQHRLPVVSEQIFNAAIDAVVIVSHGVDVPDLFARSAYFVDRILRGARAGDLPVESLASYRMQVNMKAADAIGLTVPASILVRADRVVR